MRPDVSGIVGDQISFHTSCNYEKSCYEDSSILSLISMARLQKASLWGERPAECLESMASLEVDGGDAYLTKESKMLSLKIEKSERSVPSFDPSHFINQYFVYHCCVVLLPKLSLVEVSFSFM